MQKENPKISLFLLFSLTFQSLMESFNSFCFNYIHSPPDAVMEEYFEHCLLYAICKLPGLPHTHDLLSGCNEEIINWKH